MFYKPLFAFFLLLISTFIHAQNTSITGTASDAAGKIIRLKTWSDQISYRDTTLTISQIDSSGQFKLQFNLATTIPAWLSIGLSKAELYLEPGHAYQIKFHPVKRPSNYPNFNPYLLPQNLEFTLADSDSSGLNSLIGKADSLLDDFLQKNLNPINPKRNKSNVEPFLEELSNHFQSINNKFFTEYIKYNAVTIREIFGLMGKAEIARKYIRNSPVLYNHPAYMNFFNDFFQEYLLSQSQNISLSDLDYTINNLQSLPTLMDSLGKDSLLQNETLREFVLLKNIRSLYQSDNFNKKAVLKILTDMENTSKFPEHQLVARNLIFELQRFETGQPAPDFRLNDMKNKPFSLDDFRGKYVYLSFYTSWCRPCTEELDTLQKMAAKINDSICFVTISEDNSIEILSDFLKKKTWNWTFLFDDTQGELPEKYGINSFPLYILIDPEGNFLQFPAPAPGEKLEKTFNQILSKSR